MMAITIGNTSGCLPLSETGQIPETPHRVHLNYLDGLRGLAALYIVFHHAYMNIHYQQGGGSVSSHFLRMFKFLDFGHYAVDVFIVLSGYCLMLPVARKADNKLRGTFREYITRRARRILPPYYAAILLSVVSVFILHALTLHAGVSDPLWQADLRPPVLISHFFLLHNILPGTTMLLDTPLWSVATEWQIYFIFPVLLWLNRRGGILLTVILTLVIGTLPHYVLHGLLDPACPWFIGLFTMGMVAAIISLDTTRDVPGRTTFPWGTVSAILWGALATFGILAGGWYKSHRWFADPLFGIATSCLLVHCTRQILQGNGHRLSLSSLLSSRAVVLLGSFSYSLYLIHFPLLVLGQMVLIGLHLSPIVCAACLFTIIIPLTTVCAALFSHVFERPFMAKTE